MSDSIDIREAISKSTSDVALSALAKQGFKRVKVLNREAIERLIHEAVHRVVTSHESLGERERAQIQEDAHRELQQLMEERRNQAAHAVALEQRVQELTEESERLCNQLAERDAQIKALQENAASSQGALGEALVEMVREIRRGRESEAPASELGELRSSIEALCTRLSQATLGGGGGAAAAPVAPEAVIETLFSSLGDGEVESNIEKVEVKNAQASGVSKTLEKLKSLNKAPPKED